MKLLTRICCGGTANLPDSSRLTPQCAQDCCPVYSAWRSDRPAGYRLCFDVAEIKVKLHMRGFTRGICADLGGALGGEGPAQDVSAVPTGSLRAEDFHFRDPRPVRYGFDRVVVTGPRAALPEPPDVAEDWSQVGTGIWMSSAQGSYQAVNDRSDMREGPSVWIKKSGWATHPVGVRVRRVYATWSDTSFACRTS